jgi:hypothetical protein
MLDWDIFALLDVKPEEAWRGIQGIRAANGTFDDERFSIRKENGARTRRGKIIVKWNTFQ